MAAKKSDKKARKDAKTDLAVNKTYKLYINGAFPRTESGRYFELKNSDGGFMANMCLATRKDFRNAMVAARAAQQGWQDRSAYNKSQIIYRMAEMLDQKQSLFEVEMVEMGYSETRARDEFQSAVDLLVYYAGWCDKYIQVYSNVNPVASSHFNFSLPEPMGVVAVMASNSSALVGLIQAVIPQICGGNAVVVLASKAYAASAISFAEVLATSDLPAGVINILTGERDELRHHFASHMDVNAVITWDATSADSIEIGNHAADSVKRLKFYESETLETGNPEAIMATQEIKTTWHPIQNIAGSKSGY